MIEQLLDYARTRHLASEPGFKAKNVHWYIRFSATGSYIGVLPTNVQDARGGVLIDRCPDLSQPEIKSGGSGCRHFLVDGLDVVALWTKGAEPDPKLLAKHAYFVGLIEAASAVETSLSVIAPALRDERVLARIAADLTGYIPKPLPSQLATIVIDDVEGRLRILVKEDSWRGWWRAFRNSLRNRREPLPATVRTEDGPCENGPTPDARRMLCCATGELVFPVATHPKINGLADVGGLATGDVLHSFKQDAFRSYGLEQAANAPMSENTATAYVTALNHLIRNNSRKLAGSRIVYWYSCDVPQALDPILAVIEPEQDDEQEPAETDTETRAFTAEEHSQERRHRDQAEARATRLAEAIRTGADTVLINAQFHAITLSANSGRVVFRDWQEGRLQDLARAVDTWFDHLRIIRRDGKALATRPKFFSVLAATVRDVKNLTAPLESALWRCALHGETPIPQRAMAMALQRFRVDLIDNQPTRHAQVGLLKAYCLRSLRSFSMTEGLDPELHDPAYLSGRILALLGAIQKEASRGLNVGLVQSYYGAASTSPALVLGRLVSLSQRGHLPQIRKEKPGLCAWYEQRMAEIWAKLRGAPPRTLTLEQQTLFALGFYHQQAHRYDKDDGENG